jgi:hypothetical protein
LLVFFDDMRVGEIQIDGGGGQPIMPEDFLNRSQGDVLLKSQCRERVPLMSLATLAA